jgi:hypothetical protein
MKTMTESETRKRITYAITELDRKIADSKNRLDDSMNWEHESAQYWVEAMTIDIKMFRVQRDALKQLLSEVFA